MKVHAGLSGTTAIGLFGSACLAVGCFAPLASMKGSQGFFVSLLGNGLTLHGAGLAVIAGVGIVLLLAGREKFLVVAGSAAAVFTAGAWFTLFGQPAAAGLSLSFGWIFLITGPALLVSAPFMDRFFSPAGCGRYGDIDALERLMILVEKGFLTREAFGMQKARIFSSPDRTGVVSEYAADPAKDRRRTFTCGAVIAPLIIAGAIGAMFFSHGLIPPQTKDGFQQPVYGRDGANGYPGALMPSASASTMTLANPEPSAANTTIPSPIPTTLPTTVPTTEPTPWIDPYPGALRLNIPFRFEAPGSADVISANVIRCGLWDSYTLESGSGKPVSAKGKRYVVATVEIQYMSGNKAISSPPPANFTLMYDGGGYPPETLGAPISGAGKCYAAQPMRRQDQVGGAILYEVPETLKLDRAYILLNYQPGSGSNPIWKLA